MQCRYLYRHNPAGNKWSVASCSARNSPYVPSMSELEKFCAGGRHARCPAYLCAVELDLPEDDETVAAVGF